jgi:ABC-2 type transport system permease protein
MSDIKVSAPTRRFSDRSIVQLTLVRFREFIRQPEAVFWTFVFPILLAVGLGLAFRSRPPERPHVGIVINDANSAQILGSLKKDSSLMAESFTTDTAAEHALRTGKIAILATSDGNGGVRYTFGPQRSESANARLVADRAIQAGAGRVDPVASSDKKVTERGSRYIDFVIPGLLGMNLMGSGIWGLGFAIVDSRSKRLLKRFMATPMSRAEYLMSFLFSRMFFLILEVITLLGFGVLAFKVPMRGSIGSLALICVISALAFGGIGLLIASRAKTIEGVSGLMNFVMMPMWIFSGVFFSYERFPAVLHPFIKALPLTALNDALRATVLEGASLASQSSRLLVMAVWGVLSFLLALRVFRWT